jgi:hypothetical protein
MSYIMGRSLTLRTTDAILTSLERRARRVKVPKSALAERYIEEGLSMDTFPGIVFRDGPAGRRPGVVGGPDVWEVIQAFLAEGGDIKATADNLEISPGLVEAASAYYSANRDAIDNWIESNIAMIDEARESVARAHTRKPA